MQVFPVSQPWLADALLSLQAQIDVLQEAGFLVLCTIGLCSASAVILLLIALASCPRRSEQQPRYFPLQNGDVHSLQPKLRPYAVLRTE